MWGGRASSRRVSNSAARRLLGLPGPSTAKMYDSPVSIPGGFFSGMVFFPKDGVLTRTISMEMEHGKSAMVNALFGLGVALSARVIAGLIQNALGAAR